MSPTPIDSKSAGVRNEKLILALLKQHNQLSQSQISKITGLSTSSASYIIARLREKGFITEFKEATGNRGPTPLMIKINGKGAYAVGVEITPTLILIGLYDFNSVNIEILKINISDIKIPENVCKVLDINIRGLFNKYNISENNLLGIGVGLSGSISDDGVIQLSSPLQWKQVPLRQLLMDKLKMPVEIFTTKVRLLAELALNPQLQGKDIVYLNISNGVGANAIIDGRFIKGCTNRSCEIGHIIIDPNGPQCGCGNKGCLEALISSRAIAEKIRNDIYKGTPTSIKLTDTYEFIPSHYLADWAEAIAKNDNYSLKLRDFVADNIAKAASIAVNCYDPEIVILGGDVVRCSSDFFVNAVINRFQTDVYDIADRTITVLVAQAKQKAVMLGSAMAVIQNALDYKAI